MRIPPAVDRPCERATCRRGDPTHERDGAARRTCARRTAPAFHLRSSRSTSRSSRSCSRFVAAPAADLLQICPPHFADTADPPIVRAQVQFIRSPSERKEKGPWAAARGAAPWLRTRRPTGQAIHETTKGKTNATPERHESGLCFIQQNTTGTRVSRGMVRLAVHSGRMRSRGSYALPRLPLRAGRHLDGASSQPGQRGVVPDERRDRRRGTAVYRNRADG